MRAQSVQPPVFILQPLPFFPTFDCNTAHAILVLYAADEPYCTCYLPTSTTSLTRRVENWQERAVGTLSLLAELPM